MKKRWISAVMTIALLAGTAAAATVSAAPADDVAREHKALFYDYLTYELLPLYGYASREDVYETVTSDQIAVGTAGCKLCWDQRKGLVSADVLDMNADGRPEMLVTYLADDTSGQDYNGRFPETMYASLYTLDESMTGVIHVGTLELFSSMNVSFQRINAGFMDVKNRRSFVVEDFGNAYFADGAGTSFTYYIYDGNAFRKLYMIGKTDGGSSDIAYKLVRTDSEGGTATKLLWADDSYMYSHPEYEPLVSYNEGNTGDGMEAGFDLLGLGEDDRVIYENSSWTMFNESEDMYPTYSTTSLMTHSFTFEVSGERSDGYSVRHLKSSLKDGTALKSRFEYRGVDWEDYVNTPGGGAQAQHEEEETREEARKECSGNVSQVFPDSSDRLLTKDDISGKSWDNLRQGINEIYARHGYIFKTPEILKFFRNFSWYEEKYDDQNDVYGKMNKTEQKNVKFLNQYVDVRSSSSSSDKPEDYNAQVGDVIG